jgi:DNA (cytosine-5)-methyltransferase 1
VRFFLIAARAGEPLPMFPVPTHAFPTKDALILRTPLGPISALDLSNVQGGTIYGTTTIHDALGDLTPFHWKPESKKRGRDGRTQDRPSRGSDGILEVTCRLEDSACGPPPNEPAYRTAPRTTAQVRARTGRAISSAWGLQHYTRTFQEELVRKYVHPSIHFRTDQHSQT